MELTITITDLSQREAGFVAGRLVDDFDSQYDYKIVEVRIHGRKRCNIVFTNVDPEEANAITETLSDIEEELISTDLD